MTKDSEISQSRRFAVAALGVITLLCGVLLYLSFAFVTWQAVTGIYAGPFIVFYVLFLTAPLAIICTVISLILAGPRHCKLAWISLCLYPLFFIIVFILGRCAPNLFTMPHYY